MHRAQCRLIPILSLVLVQIAGGGQFFLRADPRFGTPWLQIDGTESSLRHDIIPRPPETGPLDIADDEPVNLRVYIDRSIVEVFANDIQYLTLRVYPQSPDRRGNSVFVRGGTARVASLEAWHMKPTRPELVTPR